MYKILVIEDDPTMLLIMQEILESNGYEVKTALNADDGIDIYRHDQIDLVITDIVMPQKDGLEIISALKTEFKGVKIITVSGAKDHVLKTAELIGAKAVIRKPFRTDHFIAKVEDVLST